jgi:bleomycin hydrolase
MGCDVGKQFARDQGVWDKSVYEYDQVYGVDNYEMSKADRLRYGNTLMTHAMLFTGVDVVEDKMSSDKKQARRWRVENSWGPDKCGVKGFATMNDSWFDEYMFEIAVPRKMLTAEHLAALETVPVVLNAWDPMGSLAK